MIIQHLGSFISQFLDSRMAGGIILIFTILGGLGGLILVYQKIDLALFEKRMWLGKLASLAAGTSIKWFSEILGQPVFVNKFDEFTQYVYVNKSFYVDAVTNTSDKIASYSVTTRQSNFNPSFSLGPHSNDGSVTEIKLGKTTFNKLDRIDQGSVMGGVGARRASYWEEYSFGNPGLYQTYYFGMNDAGIVACGDTTALHAIKPEEVLSTTDVRIVEFRKHCIINSFCISEPLNEAPRINHGWLGVNLDQVRVLKQVDPPRSFRLLRR